MTTTDTQQGGQQSAQDIAAEIVALEALYAQVADYAEIIKDRFAALKSKGHDVKALRKVIARRKRDRDEVADEDAMIEMIESALEGK